MTRESYCMSMLSAAFALKEVKGSLPLHPTAATHVGMLNDANEPVQTMPTVNQSISSALPPRPKKYDTSMPITPLINNNISLPTPISPLANFDEIELNEPKFPATKPATLPEESQAQPSKSTQLRLSTAQPNGKQHDKQLPAPQEFEDANSSLPFMIISLFSLFFSLLWFFFVKLPFRIGSTLFTLCFLAVTLHILWLFLADDNSAWEMGAGVEYEYNMPGVY